MTDRPLIGLTGRRKTGADVMGTPKELQVLEADWFYADYARGVLAAGGLPVNLPLDADPALYMDRLDGILLSGGADIDPGRYGAPPETNDFPPELGRDAYEFTLLGHAAEAQLPVLGICRGLQLINVFAGGSLNQHIPDHARFNSPPNQHAHAVHLAEGSTLRRLYGNDTMTVNSLHHQTVDQLGSGLAVAAQDPDGSVEGIEHQSLPILGVQWHPEMQDTRDTDPVFAWIVEQARG